MATVVLANSSFIANTIHIVDMNKITKHDFQVCVLIDKASIYNIL